MDSTLPNSTPGLTLEQANNLLVFITENTKEKGHHCQIEALFYHVDSGLIAYLSWWVVTEVGTKVSKHTKVVRVGTSKIAYQHVLGKWQWVTL